MAERRTLGLAGAAAAAVGGAVVLRRSLRGLDAADSDTDRPLDTDTTFPPGEVTEVTTDDGGLIAAESVGSGPVVVLVHGITSSRQDWGPVARELLAKGHRVVGLDQRGHGGSDPGSEGYSPERLGADLAQTLSALDLRDVVLVGHSMGGIAAMVFAVEHPEVFAERVRSMVLVATTSRTPRLLRRPPVRLVELVLGRASADWAIRRPALARSLFGRFGSTRLVEAALASARRARPRHVARCAAGLVGYDVTERLATITTPTRCFYGTQDVVTSARANRLIARTIPGALATEIPGAGHLLIWTHVDQLVEQVVASREPV
ncbi:MAG: alpha/beta hydrolase [Actinomycetota bacterium]